MIVAPIGMSLKLDFSRPAFMVDLPKRQAAKEHGVNTGMMTANLPSVTMLQHLRELFQLDPVNYMLAICGTAAPREFPSLGTLELQFNNCCVGILEKHQQELNYCGTSSAAFVDKLLCLVLICFPKLAIISSVFAAGRQLRAVERPVDSSLLSSSSKSFTGIERLLLSFLESIKNFEWPKELGLAEWNTHIHVALVRKDENCLEPEKQQVPSQGIGRTLGYSSNVGELGALYGATRRGNLKTIRLLKKKDFDAYIPSGDGNIPFLLVARGDHGRVRKPLICSEAECDAEKPKGKIAPPFERRTNGRRTRFSLSRLPGHCESAQLAHLKQNCCNLVEEGESEMESGYISGSRRSSFASQRHVNYCCGSCGYELNLSSSNRNTATIGSKYGKSIKRGIISFFHIDQSKFTHVDEFRCIPYFISKHSWGLFRQKTKLLCRKCGNHVGYAYDDRTFPYPLVTDGSNSSPVTEISSHIKFEIRIRALQPSSIDQSGTSPFT
ncbi:hypothetical protein Nepgr_002541 [Nepenthes gracilis]|uniref:SEP domain-containing protein n=1 Tax=Nepenthes gracilis TaxID=150966 RepID=A0AAD3P786_NEPGR|nr:hypothetical protein Nepgr_002541 [Nepenthes gracilis]